MPFPSYPNTKDHFHEPVWAQTHHTRSLIRRRLWLGRSGWLLAFILGSLLFWRMKTQEQEVNVLLNRLVALEEVDSRQVWGVAPFARASEGEAVADEIIEELGREGGHGVPQSLSGDGETGLLADAREERQVVLRETREVRGQRSWARIDTLFVFGDSYTATGALTREESDPVEDNPLDEHGRFSIVKPVWIDFVTQVYNSTPFTTSNFAAGGSTVDEDVVAPYLAGSSLRRQMRNLFLTRYSLDRSTTTKPIRVWNPSSTLFMIWLGVNDIAMYYGRNPDPASPRVPLAKLFVSYRRRVLELYGAGARNFLFVTVPPFDRSLKMPADGEELERRNQLIADIAAFNARLYEMAEELRHILGHDVEYDDDRARQEVEVHVFDAHRLYSRVLQEPTAFEQTEGITDTESICEELEIFGTPEQKAKMDRRYWMAKCMDGEKILAHAWTYLHSTSRMHDVTGAKVVEDCLGEGGWKGYCK